MVYLEMDSIGIMFWGLENKATSLINLFIGLYLMGVTSRLAGIIKTGGKLVTDVVFVGGRNRRITFFGSLLAKLSWGIIKVVFNLDTCPRLVDHFSSVGL